MNFGGLDLQVRYGLKVRHELVTVFNARVPFVKALKQELEAVKLERQELLRQAAELTGANCLHELECAFAMPALVQASMHSHSLQWGVMEMHYRPRAQCQTSSWGHL